MTQLATLQRFFTNGESSVGKLTTPRGSICFTLEDEPRSTKVAGETCIPPGEYNVTLRTEGGFHTRYSKKFSDIHQGMLWIRDVPNFEYILIHVGNTDDNTEGCVLLGENAHLDFGENRVLSSVKAYRRIYPELAYHIQYDGGLKLRVQWQQVEIRQ